MKIPHMYGSMAGTMASSFGATPEDAASSSYFEYTDQNGFSAETRGSCFRLYYGRSLFSIDGSYYSYYNYSCSRVCK